jgi:hypothetical protein
MGNMRFMTSVGLCLAGLACCGSVRGQSTLGAPGSGTLTQPVVSPYINLLRSGSPGYLNYYGLVRPENTLRNSVQGVQQQVNANSYQIDSFQGSNTELTTGTHSYFLNSSRYFLNRGQVPPAGMVGPANRTNTLGSGSMSGTGASGPSVSPSSFAPRGPTP